MSGRGAAKGSVRELTHWVTESGENPTLDAHVAGVVKKGSREVAALAWMVRVMGGTSFLVARMPSCHALFNCRITPLTRVLWLYLTKES